METIGIYEFNLHSVWEVGNDREAASRDNQDPYQLPPSFSLLGANKVFGNWIKRPSANPPPKGALCRELWRNPETENPKP